jgi:peptidoglycan hydrolase FlgJ
MTIMDVTNVIKPLPADVSPVSKEGCAVSNSKTNRKDAKLRKACADFEGILLNYMFEGMRKTVGEGGVFGNSFQKNMYESMFTQEMCTSMARGKGAGIGETLYRQISARTKDQRADSSQTMENGGSQVKVPPDRYK